MCRYVNILSILVALSLQAQHSTCWASQSDRTFEEIDENFHRCCKLVGYATRKNIIIKL